ncbi:hypothetical protein ACIRBY_16485 [Streptomyces sp. NPDC096136]|uniref:hypothetical protein n=1 Tax=Streptomyces sp. NPDC096136 TaxID=3366076 RepID=UPI003808A5FD
MRPWPPIRPGLRYGIWRAILFVLTGDRTLPMPEIDVIPATSDTAAPLPVDRLAP